jgi:hypothetical protein
MTTAQYKFKKPGREHRKSHLYPPLIAVQKKAKELGLSEEAIKSGEFSHPELTAWYVKEFNQLNHLRSA